MLPCWTFTPFHYSLQHRQDHLPKNAIANGWFVGVVPAYLVALTRTEQAMVNLAIPSVYLSTVRGGENMVLRSHAYMLRARPGPVAAQLPRNVAAHGLIKVTAGEQQGESEFDGVVFWGKEGRRHDAPFSSPGDVSGTPTLALSGAMHHSDNPWSLDH
jgi:hypothetical protein